MKKAICFGASEGVKIYFDTIEAEYDVIAFADNAKIKWGKEWLGKEIISPEEIKKYQFDYIIVTSPTGRFAIPKQLTDMGIDEAKIIIPTDIKYQTESRIEWLRSLSELHADIDKTADVAEAGVFQGEFAKYINSFYSDRKIHLFDTFEGFSDSDVHKEKGLSSAAVGNYSNTDVELVLRKLSHPENAVIHKGYFPQTAEGIISKFCYVNLDMDLYQPTLEGLRFFAPKMVKGGVISVHDYFWGGYEKSIKKAVHEFIDETEMKNLRLIPIGDKISVAVVGF